MKKDKENLFKQLFNNNNTESVKRNLLICFFISIFLAYFSHVDVTGVVSSIIVILFLTALFFFVLRWWATLKEGVNGSLIIGFFISLLVTGLMMILFVYYQEIIQDKIGSNKRDQLQERYQEIFEMNVKKEMSHEERLEISLQAHDQAWAEIYK